MREIIQSLRGRMAWAALAGLTIGGGATQTPAGALAGILIGAGSVVAVTLIRNRIRAHRQE
ncbi:MAG: hypothetical protein KGL42_00415 [Betaproteobacteria bacterium]|nr:hypothetical protein [Betaproteobacteria bacterium]